MGRVGTFNESFLHLVFSNISICDYPGEKFLSIGMRIVAIEVVERMRIVKFRIKNIFL